MAIQAAVYGCPEFKRGRVCGAGNACAQNSVTEQLEETSKGFVADPELKRLFEICIGNDSHACISETQISVLSDIFKHFDLKHKFLVDNMCNRRVILQYTPMKQMVADFLTKNLSEQRF